jgi:hypothetical protein
VVRLTRLLTVLVRALTRTRRRRVATIAIPALVLVALIAPRALGGDNPASDRGVLAGAGAAGGTGSTEATPTGTIPAATGLPGTTGPAPGPTVRPRPVPVLGSGPADAARSYVLTADAHDARPGKDHGFLDSYLRARRYVSTSLYALITAPSQRGDYLWAAWTKAQATVTVQVLRVAVPDGAPPPTPNTAYVRVQFRQVVTPHAATGGRPASTDDAVSLVVTKDGHGHWVVTQLLAGS